MHCQEKYFKNISYKSPAANRTTGIFKFQKSVLRCSSQAINYAKSATATARLTAKLFLWSLMRSISCSVSAVR